MSVMVQLEANLKSEDVYDDFVAYGRSVLPDTRAYEGCEGLTINRNMDDPKNFSIVEQWETRAHYEKYLAWRGETGVLDKLGSFLSGPPNIRFFTNVGV